MRRMVPSARTREGWRGVCKHDYPEKTQEQNQTKQMASSAQETRGMATSKQETRNWRQGCERDGADGTRGMTPGK